MKQPSAHAGDKILLGHAHRGFRDQASQTMNASEPTAGTPEPAQIAIAGMPARFDTGNIVQAPALRLRLLSYNIQVGLHTGHFGHYLSGAWRHVLPHATSLSNLDRIAEVIRDYDFVAIQEADAGSLRTRNLNQMEHLAVRAGFPHFGFSVTRDLRPVAQHCLGYLSRWRTATVRDQALPSPIPGRRALTVGLDSAACGLTLLITHLSLGRATQRKQLDSLSSQVPATGPVVLLGDLNCEAQELRSHAGLQRCGLRLAAATPPTFPSWRPRRAIDHLLVSGDVVIENLHALPEVLSDHLPLAADILVRPRL